MDRNDVKTLANAISNNLEDPDSFEIFLDDVFDALGWNPNTPTVQATLVTLTSGTATYSYETDMLKLLNLIMYDELITEVTEEELSTYASTWPADSGTPVAFTRDDISQRKYTLYPNPDTTSTACTYAAGQPFGSDYPADILTLIYTDNRQTNLIDLLAFPLTFDALSREFFYPSDHTDKEFSMACTALTKLFYSLIGVL